MRPDLFHVTDPIPPLSSKHYVCPICGKGFYVHDKNVYTYKRQVYVNGKKHKTVYVHTWTCLLRLEDRIKKKDLSFLEDYNQ